MTSILRPDKFPEWASEDHIDPEVPVPNVVEPGDSKKKHGWFYKEYPPANWFNWLLRYIYRWITYLDDQTTYNTPVFAIDTGTVNNLVITPVPALTSLTDGKLFIVRAKFTVTGATTLQVNALLPKPVVDLDESVLVGGEVLANGMYMFIYSAAADKFFLQSKPDVSSGFLTGDMIISSRQGTRDGFINYYKDETIGDALSSASLLHDPIAENLFKYWWNTYAAACPVDGGRGVSADADWLAHKRIHVFPYYDRILAAQGSANGGPGYMQGSRTQSLGEANNGGHQHYDPYDCSNNSILVHGDGSQTVGQRSGNYTNGSGSGAAFSIVPPIISTNVYVKL